MLKTLGPFKSGTFEHEAVQNEMHGLTSFCSETLKASCPFVKSAMFCVVKEHRPITTNLRFRSVE